MKHPVAITVAVVAVVVALGAGMAASAPQLEQPAWPADRPYPAIPDAGTDADVQRIRFAVPRILTDWVAAGRADGEVGDENIIQIVQDALGEEPNEARRQLLASVLVPELVDPEAEAAADQLWRTIRFVQPSLVYVGNGFEVTRWDGVQVVGNSAVALVMGRQHYVFPNGTEGAEPVHQYRILLRRDSDSRYGWLLVDRSVRQDNS
jgi:hypothetical protein